jgi:hypothetical protein
VNRSEKAGASVNLLPHLMLRQTQDLQIIASRIGLSGFESSKQKLVSSIVRHLTTQSTLQQILGDLSEDAYELLRFILARGKAPTRLTDLLHACQEGSTAEMNDAIRDLENAGLVGASLESGSRREDYLVFTEVRQPLLDLMSALLPDPLKCGIAPKTIHCGANIFQDDLVTVLGYLLRNEVRTTRRTMPSRRDLRNLESLLRGERLSHLHEKFTGIPLNWMERLFSFLARQNWVSETDGILTIVEGTFTVAPSVLARLAEGPSGHPGTMERSSQERWEYQAVEEFRCKCVEDGPGWRRVGSLEEAISPAVGLFRAPQGVGHPVRAALFDLMTLGGCDLGETEGEWMWRAKMPEEMLPPDSAGMLHLQPNFEIVAPGNLPQESRLVLEEIAELISIDQLLHYRITRQSVYAALCRGWTAERQIEWYSRQVGEKRSIPQNVSHSIESWGAGYGRISLEEPLLLVCDSAELANEILHSKELSGLCVGRFSANSIVLKKESAQNVLQKLQQAGHLPLPKVGDGSRTVEPFDFPTKEGDGNGS